MMRRFMVTVLVLACTAGCISKQEAKNGAVRFLNAVQDAPRMDMYLNDRLRSSGFDYGTSSAYIAVPAGNYGVRIDERLPAAADPDARTIFDEKVPLAINDEVTLVVVGDAAANGEEVLQIPTRTRGVTTGTTRVQFVHAGAGGPPVDAYVLAPGALVDASAPFATNLAYKAYTEQREITAGSARVVLTAAGDPDTVLLETNSVFLTLEGTLLIAVVPNTALNAATRPFYLVFMSGAGSSVVQDKDTPGNVRVANASPGSYSLDAFVNNASVDKTERQVCDPGTSEADTLLELCALPYETVGQFNAIAAGSYGVKVQKTGDDAVAARTFSGVFGAGGQSTLVLSGLISDTATTTEVGLQTVLGTRRVATAAQLRLISSSLAADAAIAGDPTTDQLEIYITAPGASLADATPTYTGVRFGSDTAYVSELPGDYQITLAVSDTATPDVEPQVLLTQVVSLNVSGIYTLIIADSIGGVQPLKFLSLDDDPAP